MEIKDREVFAVGTHNGDKYSIKDLDDMVEAFNALDYRPALKPGHTDEPGTPALGYLANLRRVGDKLIADFVDLPQKVFDMIRDKAFDRVSAEIYWNFERAGKVYRRALKALALLGAEVPAVAGLKPLSDGLYSEKAELRSYEFALVVSSADPQRQKESADMDKDEVARIAREAAEAATAEAEKKFTAQLNAEKEARESAEKKHAADMKAEREAREALASEANKARINGIAEKCKLPALRPYVAAFADMGLAMPAAKTYAMKGDMPCADCKTPGECKKNGMCAMDKKNEVSPIDVVTHFVDTVNAAVVKLYQESGHKHVEGHDGEPKTYANRNEAGKEADKRANALIAKNSKLSYVDALQQALDADPELKAAYTARETREKQAA